MQVGNNSHIDCIRVDIAQKRHLFNAKQLYHIPLRIWRACYKFGLGNNIVKTKP